MIKEAIVEVKDTVIERNALDKLGTVIHEDLDRIFRVIPERGQGGAVAYKIRDDAKPCRKTEHELASVEGLLDFLASKEMDQKVQLLATRGQSTGLMRVVFVRESQILVDLAYDQTAPRLPGGAAVATLETALKNSPEMDGLKKLIGKTDGWTPKGLWRLLVTDLRGRIATQGGPDLLSVITRISVRQKANVDVEISPLGVESGSASTSLSIGYKDKAGNPVNDEIPTEFTWRGRLWSAFQRECEIKLTLEVADGGGFIFHAGALADVFTAELRALVEHLREQVTVRGIERVEVYDGVW